MAWSSFAPVVLGGALLAACSSSPGGSSPGPAPGNGTLYGVCSQAPASSEAQLGMFVSGVYGFTLPVPAGQTQDVTLTVLNSGGAPATQITDLTPQSSTLSYKGGSYPGTGGTCGDTLGETASCTLVVTLAAPTTGRHTSLVVLQYYDGVIVTTDAHQVTAVAETGTFATASHAPLPQMPDHGGEAPLGKVNFVTVSFSDTPQVSEIEKYGDWLVTSPYWLTIGKDYGVGAGTHQHVSLSDGSPDSVVDQDFASYVDGKVSSGALPGGAEDVYVFFLSLATTVTDQPGAAGWHNRSGGGHAYAVILPGCSSDPTSILANYAFVAAHELIESATDPAPLSGYDFGFGEGEVADLCDGLSMQGNYGVPTVWSNSAAAKGGDPCVPASGLPFIDVDPSPATISISAKSGTTTVVTLTGWSSQQEGDWLVEASLVGSAASGLIAAFDPETTDLVNNGGKVRLSLSVDGSVSPGSSAVLQLLSYAPSGADASIQGIQLVPISVTE